MRVFCINISICAIFFLLPETLFAGDTMNHKFSKTHYLSIGAGKGAFHGERMCADFFSIKGYFYSDRRALYNAACGVQINDKRSIWLAASYEMCSGRWFQKISGLGWGSSREDNVYNNGNFRSQIFTLAFESATNYYNSKNTYITLYRLWGVGIAYRNEVVGYINMDYYFSSFRNGVTQLSDEMEQNNNRLKFKFQITPIAISFGRKFRVYSEFGLGYRGLLNVGIIGKL